MSTNNLGCLRPYVKVAQLLNPQFRESLINQFSTIKGFLINFQIPLICAFGIYARGKMVEVGCWFGRTSSVLLFSSDDLKLFCVDTFRGSEEHQSELQGRYFREDFEKTLAPYRGRYVIHEGMSHEVAVQFEDNSLDYVWIDASHDYLNVKRDVEVWTPKLKLGGLLLGHDYPEPTDPNGGFEELTRAVNETVRDSSLFSDFGYFCGIWGARKL